MDDSATQYGIYKIVRNNNAINSPVLYSGGVQSPLYDIISFIVTKSDLVSYTLTFGVNIQVSFVTDFATGDTGQQLLVEQAMDVIKAQLDAGSLIDNKVYFFELTLHGFQPVANPSWVG